MGALRDALTKNTHRWPCAVRTTLEEHPDLRDELLESLADASVTPRQLSTALASLGIRLNEQRIYYHRKGRCSCG